MKTEKQIELASLVREFEAACTSAGLGDYEKTFRIGLAKKLFSEIDHLERPQLDRLWCALREIDFKDREPVLVNFTNQVIRKLANFHGLKQVWDTEIPAVKPIIPKAA